jgi:hypothetical protein
MLPFERGHDGHYGCDITDVLTRCVPELPLRQSTLAEWPTRRRCWSTPHRGDAQTSRALGAA